MSLKAISYSLCLWPIESLSHTNGWGFLFSPGWKLILAPPKGYTFMLHMWQASFPLYQAWVWIYPHTNYWHARNHISSLKFTASQNGLGFKGLSRSSSSNPCCGRAAPHQLRLPRAPPNPAWSTYREWGTTAPPSQLLFSIKHCISWVTDMLLKPRSPYVCEGFTGICGGEKGTWVHAGCAAITPDWLHMQFLHCSRKGWHDSV